MVLCLYGCGQEAKFKSKGGRNMCESHSSKCPAIKTKNSLGGKKSHKANPLKYLNRRLGGIVSKDWRDENPEQYLKAHKKSGLTFHLNIKSGKISASMLGKHLSPLTKQRLSDIAVLRTGWGWSKCKYYEVYCPYLNATIKVQGTWLFKYALWLNLNSISWERKRSVNLQWVIPGLGFHHTYYPDFYLPDSDEYIEIKGHFPLLQQYKMKLVKLQHPDKSIKILRLNDLKKFINI